MLAALCWLLLPVIRTAYWNSPLAPSNPAAPHLYDDGQYSFLAVQSYDATQPVSWNRCRPIKVVVATRYATDQALRAVDESIKVIQGVTSLTLERENDTAERPTAGTQIPDTVTISFASNAEVARLGSEIEGYGGSVYRTFTDRRRFYESGQIVLNRSYVEKWSRWYDRARIRALLLHEWGHVVGLGHVRDRGQLMYPVEGQHRIYGHGDLTGLARLGTQPCA